MTSHTRTYRSILTLILVLLSWLCISTPAMAAGHRLGVHKPLGIADNGFKGGTRVSNSDLDNMRGGTYSFNGITLSYLDLQQTIREFNPITNMTTTKTSSSSYTFTASTGSQSANLAQAATQLVSQTLNINTTKANVAVQNNITVGLIANLQALQGLFRNFAVVQNARLSR